MEKKRALASRSMKRVAKAVVKDLPLEPLVEWVLKQALSDVGRVKVHGRKLEHTVEDAVREALQAAVSYVVRETTKAEMRT